MPPRSPSPSSFSESSTTNVFENYDPFLLDDNLKKKHAPQSSIPFSDANDTLTNPDFDCQNTYPLVDSRCTVHNSRLSESDVAHKIGKYKK